MNRKTTCAFALVTAALTLTAALVACSSGDGAAPNASTDAGTQDDSAVDADPGEAAVDAGVLSFTTTGALNVARSAHTATLLADGRVLVVGGEDADRTMIDSIEIYDPTAATWTQLGHLPAPRSNHSATLLANGKVLVVGGGETNMDGLPTGTGVTASAVLVDPAATDASAIATETGAMTMARSHHVAAILPNGNVLVAGGEPSSGDAGTTAPPLAEAEVYDVSQGTWSAVGPLTKPRAMASVAVVSGKVVVAGGFTSDGTTPPAIDVYDPAAQTFTSPGALAGTGRVYGAMTTLAGSSSAILVGGITFGKVSSFLNDSEIFSDGAFHSAGEISDNLDAIAVVALADGRAVALGGFTNLPAYAPVANVSIYAPSHNAWYAAGLLKTRRSSPTATLLQSGRILVVGGLGANDVLTSCELSSVP